MDGDGPDSTNTPTDTTIHVRPLPQHPELEVIQTKVGESWVNEYRVANFRTLESGRVVIGDGGWGWVDLVVIGLALLLVRSQNLVDGLVPLSNVNWGIIYNAPGMRLLVATLLVLLCRPRRRVHQSVTAIPNLGLQLSTTKALAGPLLNTGLTYSTTKTFIPLSDISTIVINEGLQRWSVRYFLAVIKRDGRGIHVAFDLVRPRHAVLVEVYHGLHETLFDEWAEPATG